MSLPLSDPLENLDADALRALLRERDQQLATVLVEKEAQIARRERLLNLKDTTIAQLTHEIAVLRRFRFGKKSEQVTGVQGSLLEEAVAADIAAIEEELHQLTDHPRKATPQQQPKRQALGRRNWLFAGSLRAGRRAAAVMSLIQSANLNGLDPHAYLKDVLTRLPTHPNSRIDELLPHNWRLASA